MLVGAKDNLCTANMPSTGGSRILEGYQPAYDATAVRRLREAGAIVVGKTNLDEFGMASTTKGSAFQVTKNPRDDSRVPGGSSGGSASAVSARQCVLSLGSDTGGSVRQPASFCGVVGSEPTYGWVSLDVVGCFGSSVFDTATILSVVAGHDKMDSTSSSRVPDCASELVSLGSLESKPLNGLRIGIIQETLGEGVDIGVASSIEAAASHLEQLGSGVEEVKMRILMGTYALSSGYYDAYYKRAQQVNVNLTGLPPLVVPCGFVEGGPAGLPVGLQMIGSPFSEGNLNKHYRTSVFFHHCCQRASCNLGFFLLCLLGASQQAILITMITLIYRSRGFLRPTNDS